MKVYWLDSGKSLTIAEFRNTGIDAFWVDEEKELKTKLRKLGFVFSRGLNSSYHDEVSLGPETPNLETIEANFCREHKHMMAEVRYILDGEGIFDIRDYQDQWVRIEVKKEDFICIPARRYHRFFLTDKKSITARRYFKDDKGWIAIYRDEIT